MRFVAALLFFCCSLLLIAQPSENTDKILNDLTRELLLLQQDLTGGSLSSSKLQQKLREAEKTIDGLKDTSRTLKESYQQRIRSLKALIELLKKPKEELSDASALSQSLEEDFPKVIAGLKQKILIREIIASLAIGGSAYLGSAALGADPTTAIIVGVGSGVGSFLIFRVAL